MALIPSLMKVSSQVVLDIALKQNEWDTELFGNFGPIHVNLMCIILTFYNGGEIIYIYIYIS